MVCKQPKTTTNGDTDRETTNYHWWDGKSPLKKFDAGATSGVGVEHKKMQYGVSYDMGLANIVDFDDVKTRNRVLRFSVGYRFGKKFKQL